MNETPSPVAQKQVFLQSEADAWFQRNRAAVAAQDFDQHDPVTQKIRELVATGSQPLVKEPHLLEVGCGEARRLAHLSNHLGLRVSGIEPSALAVKCAQDRGVQAVLGTADHLPFESQSVDILVYGFCLYLCDREDLFAIAKEAFRVLKPQSWILIHDFFSPTPVKREYHHRPGMYSYKMDYRKLFDWHPDITCYDHRVSSHQAGQWTDESNEWVAMSVLRKNSP